MASEMETSTLFIVSLIRNVRAGAIMAYGSMNAHTLEIACDAIRLLIKERKMESTNINKTKKKIIIDTDCGSDDAMAIAMALNDPAYEIVLITTVAGNVDVEQATMNVLTTIEYAKTYEPPVYKGSPKMLLRNLAFAHETHGQDGMGDIGLRPKRLKPCNGNGILMLLETLRNSKEGEIDIIALGPLTNLALAIRLDPEAMKKQEKS